MTNAMEVLVLADAHLLEQRRLEFLVQRDTASNRVGGHLNALALTRAPSAPC